MKKNILIITLLMILGILFAILFSKPSKEEITREHTDEIIEDLRPLFNLPKEEVFISVVLDAPVRNGELLLFGWVIGDTINNQYTIYLTKKTKKYNLIETMIHEMVHIQQINSGSLHVDAKLNVITFKGKKYNQFYLRTVPYPMRPWEHEAFKKSREVESYLKLLEGISN